MPSRGITFNVPASAESQFQLWRSVSTQLERAGAAKRVKCLESERTVSMELKHPQIRNIHTNIAITPMSSDACTIALHGEIKWALWFSIEIKAALLDLLAAVTNSLNEQGAHACANAYCEAHNELAKGIF